MQTITIFGEKYKKLTFLQCENIYNDLATPADTSDTEATQEKKRVKNLLCFQVVYKPNTHFKTCIPSRRSLSRFCQVARSWMMLDTSRWASSTSGMTSSSQPSHTSLGSTGDSNRHGLSSLGSTRDSNRPELSSLYKH